MSELGVIGSINMDLVVRAPRFPKPGETVSGGELQMVPGGKGANQAVAMARMGRRTALFGRVGDDVFGPRLRENLQEEGIDVARVEILPGVATGVALIVLDEHGQNTIVSSHGANDAMKEDEIPALLEDWSAIQLVVMQMELPLDVVEAAIRGAKARGMQVILNAAPADVRARDWFSDIDVLIVNETEAELLSGLEVADVASATAAGKALCAEGCESVILTLGPDGALLIDGGQVQHVPAIEVEVVDTTGAGDAFVGAFTAMRAEGVSNLTAVRHGVCAGALAVGVLGAQASLPSRSAVERLYDEEFGG
ncbi:MAG: ribokinase [Anaerolineales bacterium]|nr:ribokinase [Anaerolineales bacterium]